MSARKQMRLQVLNKPWYEKVSLQDANTVHMENVETITEMLERRKDKKRPIHIVGIAGSNRHPNNPSHETSNSWLMIRKAMEHLSHMDNVTTHAFNLPTMEIEHCNGCRSSTSSLCRFPCIAAGERVQGAGMKRIEELRAGDEISTGVVTKAWQSGIKSTFWLTLSDGRRLRLTDNHPVKVITSKTRTKETGWKWAPVTEWVEVKDLEVGDKIPFVVGGDFGLGIDQAPHDFLLAGAVFGDGSFFGTNHDDVCVYYDERSAGLATALKTEVPYEVKDRKHAVKAEVCEKHGWPSSACDHMRKVVYHPRIGRMLKHRIGLDKSVSVSQRRLPDAVMEGSREQVAAFLRGWFSADGSVNMHGDGYGRVSLSSSSVQALRDAQMLFAKLGIRSCMYDLSHIKVVEENRSFTRASELQITDATHIKLFAEIVGFAENNKTAKIQEFPERRPCSRPYGKVVSIEATGVDEPVYDITVEGTHEFVAGGIPVHNCDCWPYDDMQDVYAQLTLADGILFGTPVASLQVGSRLKALIDRLISMDGGRFAPMYNVDGATWKNPESKNAEQRVGMRGDFRYVQRLAGKVCAAFATGKDSGSYDVAMKVLSAMNQRGCFIPPNAVVNWNSPRVHKDTAYDKHDFLKALEPGGYLGDLIDQTCETVVEAATLIRGNEDLWMKTLAGRT